MLVQFCCLVMSDSLQPHKLQHASPPCPAQTPRVHPNPCSLSQWCHPTISSSVIPFSSWPQFFASGGQSIGVSASTLVLPVNIQDWSPLKWTGWISLQSKGLSRVFFTSTVQKHQFFGAQLSLKYLKRPLRPRYELCFCLSSQTKRKLVHTVSELIIPCHGGFWVE